MDDIDILGTFSV